MNFKALKPIHALIFGILGCTNAMAGFGGMGNVESDGGASLDGAAAVVLLVGAAVGYYAERAYRKSQLDKAGGRYTSEYLGGKTGAIVGAIGLPLLIGLLR